jgi:hypothetical protein
MYMYVYVCIGGEGMLFCDGARSVYVQQRELQERSGGNSRLRLDFFFCHTSTFPSKITHISTPTALPRDKMDKSTTGGGHLPQLSDKAQGFDKRNNEVTLFRANDKSLSPFLWERTRSHKGKIQTEKKN